jgi:hypothetical protein
MAPLPNRVPAGNADCVIQEYVSTNYRMYTWAATEMTAGLLVDSGFPICTQCSLVDARAAGLGLKAVCRLKEQWCGDWKID